MEDFQQNYKKAFYVDGSLRDIYVHGTTEQDWQRLLTFLLSSSYHLEFMVDEQQRQIPAQVEDIFVLTHDYGVTLSVDETQLALHCHFFTTKEIEFDLDPRNMNNEQRISRLLDFIHTIGRLLNKEVVLTPENASWVPLFRFDPRTAQEEWYLEDIDWPMTKTVSPPEQGS